MKNNTAYLKNIHWVLLLAVAYGLFSVYVSPWLYELFADASRVYPSIILSVFYMGITYAGIGIVTSKWKELLVAFIIAEAIFAAYILLPGGNDITGLGYRPIIYFFAVPIPLTIFICLQIGWNKQLPVVYLGVLLISMVLVMTSFEDGPILRLSSIRYRHNIWSDLLRLLFYIPTRVFHVILICEFLNYLQSDTKKPKTLLLNLGNEYGRFNGFITFWVLKTSLLLLGLGTANYLQVLMRSISYRYGGYEGTGGYRTYIIIIGFVGIVGAILLALFAAWYLRKLLLEYFISYNVQSKFLYWLALVPFIGFLSFLFMETSQAKQQNYNEKVASIGNFAGSSTTAISVIAFIAMFLRLVFRLSNMEGSVVLSIVLACLLFTWMIYSQVAYYVNGVVILLALAAIIVYTLMGGYIMEELLGFFGLLVIGLAQLVLFLPVYHFDKFFYTPGENPEPESSEPRDIFA